jgi:hypothetical protein
VAEPGHFVFEHSSHAALLVRIAALPPDAGTRRAARENASSWRFVLVLTGFLLCAQRRRRGAIGRDCGARASR